MDDTQVWRLLFLLILPSLWMALVILRTLATQVAYVMDLIEVERETQRVVEEILSTNATKKDDRDL